MSTEIRAAIDAANAKLSAAVAAGDAAAYAALYTTDSCFMLPGADFLRGREAIAGAIAQMIAGGVKGLELATVEVDAFGDTAVEVGTYHILAAGGATADKGKYVAIWKNQDGGWRLHRDIINTSIATD